MQRSPSPRPTEIQAAMYMERLNYLSLMTFVSEKAFIVEIGGGMHFSSSIRRLRLRNLIHRFSTKRICCNTIGQPQTAKKVAFFGVHNFASRGANTRVKEQRRIFQLLSAWLTLRLHSTLQAWLDQGSMAGQSVGEAAIHPLWSPAVRAWPVGIRITKPL